MSRSGGDPSELKDMLAAIEKVRGRSERQGPIEDSTEEARVDWLSRCTSILGVGTAIWNHRGHLTQISPTLERMCTDWGTAEGWWAVLVAKVGPARLASRLGAGGEIDIRLEAPGGGKRSFRLTASGYIGRQTPSAETASGTDMILLVSDTTISEQTQRALQDSEARYSSLFQGSSDGILVHDLEGRILETNPKAIDMLAYSGAELRRMRVMNLHPASALPTAKKAFQSIEKERSIRFEIEFLRGDGSAFPAEVSASLLEVGDRELVQAMVRDITERKKAEETLRQSEERKSAMLETALDCIVTIDAEGRILEFNPAAEATFGHRREEAIGRSMAELLLPEDYREAHQQGMARYVATGEARVLGQRLELPALRSDGQELLMEVAITRLPTSGGEVMFAGYLRDITARKQAEEKMAQALEAAREANQAKSDFLASMSHELRTPLNVISGMTELARDELEQPDIGPYLEAIASSSSSLLNLIDDLLDLSRIESGRFEIDLQPLEFRRFVEETCSSLKHRAAQKGLAFRWRTHDSVPEVLSLDGRRLKQVLLNLISNAIKFTDRGRVTLKTTAVRVDKDRYRLEIVVEDTGPGFDPTQTEQIFERFSQLRRASGSRPEGTGLGLAISQALAELMGGKLLAESSPGKGSKFKLELEAEKAEHSVVGSETEAPEIEPLNATGVVLLVDDHRLNRVLAARFLDKAGYQVIEAESGEQALELAKSGTDFDIVLMDIEMVGMGGFEATGRLRRIEKTAELPIVAVTAHASKGFREKCLEAGMDGYLSKPIDRARLLRTVRKFLDEKEPADSAGESEADHPQAAPAEQGPIYREIESDIVDLVPAFLRRCEEAVGQLSAGPEAEQVRRIGHNLKGSGSAYGFPEISRFGQQIEEEAGRGRAWEQPAEELRRFLRRLHLK